MRHFMLGAGFATGLVLTGLCVARWAFHKDYIPMCERELDDDDWGEWIYVPTNTTIDINTTLN